MIQTYAITTSDVGGVVCLALAGEFDLNAIDELAGSIARAIGRHPPASVLIDLAATTLIDSTTVQTLVNAQQAAIERQVTLTVINAHGMVERVLKVTGVYEALTGAV
jgi:anti-sigma B factor antagonist